MNFRLTKSANTSTAQSSVREVACQTKLSIPLDLDLEKILSAYMTTSEEVVVVNSNDSRLGLSYGLVPMGAMLNGKLLIFKKV